MVEGEGQRAEAGRPDAVGFPGARPRRGQLGGAEGAHHVQVVVDHRPLQRAPGQRQPEDEEEDEGARAPRNARRRRLPRRRRAETGAGRRGWKAARRRARARRGRGIGSEERDRPVGHDHLLPYPPGADLDPLIGEHVREPGPVDDDGGGPALGGQAREQLPVDLSRAARPRRLLGGQAVQVDQPQVGEVADGADVVGHHGGARGQALHQEAHLVLLLVDVLDRRRRLRAALRRARVSSGAAATSRGQRERHARGAAARRRPASASARWRATSTSPIATR